MSDQTIGLPVDGPGKKLDTEELVVSTVTVQRERPRLAGGGATDLVDGASNRQNAVQQHVTSSTSTVDKWTLAGGGTGKATNNLLISFPAASGGNWGTVVNVAIFDASTGGNMLLHGVLTVARTVNDGEQLRFAIGDLEVVLA